MCVDNIKFIRLNDSGIISLQFSCLVYPLDESHYMTSLNVRRDVTFAAKKRSNVGRQSKDSSLHLSQTVDPLHTPTEEKEQEHF